MNIERSEIAWAAGLFEGEGSIHYHIAHKEKKDYCQPKISLAMTDEDVVRKFQSVWGFGSVTGPYQRPSKGDTIYKPSWAYGMSGFQRVQFAISAMWPWLGERRCNKATEVLIVARTLASTKEHGRSRAIIPFSQYENIMDLRKSITIKQIAKVYKVHPSTIDNVIRVAKAGGHH